MVFLLLMEFFKKLMAAYMNQTAFQIWFVVEHFKIAMGFNDDTNWTLLPLLTKHISLKNSNLEN